jgi:hypothetical protein
LVYVADFSSLAGFVHCDEQIETITFVVCRTNLFW